MRVTDRAIFEAARASTLVARERMDRATAEMSSGVRVTHPGDDPMVAAQAVLMSAEAGAQQSRGRSLESTQGELDVADGALGGMADVLRRAHELTIQMGSDSYSAADRAAAASEVDGLVASLVSQANIKVGDRYLFGGTKDNAAPFSAAGAYSGAGDTRQVEIFPGIYQDVSVRADVALKGAGGGTDVITALQQLATDLRANNGNGIRSATGSVSSGLDQVLLARSQVGSYSNVVTMATTAAKAAQDAVERRKASVTEVDPFEAASNLALAQHALDAALTASAKSFQLSLLDKLR